VPDECPKDSGGIRIPDISTEIYVFSPDFVNSFVSGRCVMKNHNIWMIIGCVLPLLLIFFLPLFGVESGGLLLLLTVKS
jgi:hypothetical protein